MKALDKQVGGKHYKEYKIQPIEYIHANKIPFIEGCIIKYATRWREKNGFEDLKKIIHYAELLIDLETKATGFDSQLIIWCDECERSYDFKNEYVCPGCGACNVRVVNESINQNV